MSNDCNYNTEVVLMNDTITVGQIRIAKIFHLATAPQHTYILMLTIQFFFLVYVIWHTIAKCQLCSHGYSYPSTCSTTQIITIAI